jgi:cell division protein FtsN
VQLGAFKSSADAAQRRWARLEKEYPKLLSGLSPTVSPKKTSSGTLYRLQAIGMSDQRAHSICKHLKTKTQGCIIIHPAHH